jgi:DNA polymerase I-like protein with 3'-5' exonuclease and polymerase domains/5'-3' exonuclease
MKTKRLIVDVSSMMWTALLAGEDKENQITVEHEGRTVKVNSAQYGYDNAINMLINAWETCGIAPMNTILVYESGETKVFRRQWLAQYKETRDSRPKEAYESFGQARDKVIEAVTSLGGSAVTRAGLEGDDVIAFLCERLEGDITILTNDGDLAVLCSERVQVFRQGKVMDENPYGPFPTRNLTTYKAVVGDSSDNIPGAKGFGPKAWLNTYVAFGDDGLDVLEELIVGRQLDQLEEDVPTVKALAKIVEHKDTVYASYAAAKLYPDQVESLRRPLQWTPGYPKDKAEVSDPRLQVYASKASVVHAGNWDRALEFFKAALEQSEWVSLDLETTSSEEADAWLAANGSVVDPLDAKIVSMGLTFGRNQNHHFYFTFGHKEEPGKSNLSFDKLKFLLELMPKDVHKVIHNAAGFELPVIHKNVGELTYDGKDEPFLPNVIDTVLASSYVDENKRSGLKSLTKEYLGVDQLDYDTVTQGRKMHEMTATETLEYGAGDTLFTSALWNHFRTIMQIEGSYKAFFDVEVDCQYLVADAFVKGVRFSLERMLEIEAEDLATEEVQQKILNDFLSQRGWEGTVCPQWEASDLEDYKAIKDMHLVIVGEELTTRMRTASKVVKLMEVSEDENARLLAAYINEGNIDQINDWAKSVFKAKPALDVASPKQMKQFLYGLCGLPVRLINKLTEKERNDKPELASAVWKFNKLQRDPEAEPLTPEEQELLIAKASTDDDAVNFALKFDVADKPEVEAVLKALQQLKEVNTRKSLFYTPYRNLIYWQDGRMHPSLRQSSTVTRRFTASKPNVQQLSKKGEGKKLRSCFVAHHANAVVVSCDLEGQELRAMAALSQDPGLLAAYVGDDLKDLHSMTGAKIANQSYEDFIKDYKGDDEEKAKKANEFRQKGKIVNFASAYSGTEVSLARTLVTTLAEAKTYLEAKWETFPRYEEWVAEIKEEAKTKGYVTDLAGTRRHIHKDMTNDQKWVVEKAARAAGNFPVQGSAAVQTKRAMGAIWRSGVLSQYDCEFMFPVHDEVVFSVSKEDAPAVIKIIHACLAQPFLKGVPSKSSISIGRDYANQIELGTEYDEQVITSCLEKLFAEEVATSE